MIIFHSSLAPSLLKLNALLRKNSGVKWMLDLGHFGDEISLFDQFCKRVIDISAGQYQVQVRLRLSDVAYLRYNFVDVEKAVA